ncbi:MAG: MoxR family ATPase [Pirellulaceae bacterium]
MSQNVDALENDKIHKSRSTSKVDIATSLGRLRTELNRALRGKEAVVEMVMASLLAGGNILFDDLPGLGKTTLGRALATVIDGSFGRVQGTPDLLPTDITGFNVFNRKTNEFEFQKGPVFNDVLLIDEINRATPRTQSALFEAMAERQVSIDGSSHSLSPTFFVIATQNPVDHSGTYELPDAQLDRFSMKLAIGYPSEESEIQILADAASRTSNHSISVSTILHLSDLQDIQHHVSSIQVSEKVQRYMVRMATYVRNYGKDVRNGISPRGLITLQRVAQAHALLQGDAFVTPDHVQDVALPVLRVRVTGNFRNVDDFLSDVLRKVAVD